MRRAVPVAIACAVLVVAAANRGAAPAAAEERAPRKTSVPIIPLSEITAGMKGYGLTVFRGTEPERFEVEVVSVVGDFLPNQPIILCMASGKNLEHTKIVGGMSGSPIYFPDKDGNPRLAGALAYGWGFASDPLCGVTPIEWMLREIDRPLEPLVAAPKVREGWAAGFGDADGLRPVLTPMTVTGLPPKRMKAAEEALAPYGIMPVLGGKVFAAPGTPVLAPKFVAGGPIGVQLASGDVDWSATGTVTYVEDKKLVAFGHSFQGGGQYPLPMCGAYIHTFVASAQRSFKLSSPLGLGGTLHQDRQAGIVCELGDPPPMIPVKVRIRAAGSGRDQTWNFKLADHPFFTSFIVHQVAAGLFDATEEWTEEHTQKMRVSIDIKGYGRFEITDTNPSGAAYNSAGLGVLGRILTNPFEKVTVTGCEYDCEMIHKPSTVSFTAASVDRLEARAGETVRIACRFKRTRAEEFEHTFDYVIPQDITPGLHRFTVMNGGAAPVNAQTAIDFKSLLATLREVYRYDNASLAVVWDQGETVVEVGNSPFANLPPTALGTLLPGGEVGGPTASRFQIKSEPIPTPFVAGGSRQIAITVLAKKTE